jgi:potassium inwardly-rectifying channel subfamily J, other
VCDRQKSLETQSPPARHLADCLVNYTVFDRVILLSLVDIVQRLQCLITGIVFSKLSRPKSRAQTVIFSRNAVVCRRDGQHCLLFRVGDMQRSHIVGISLKAIVIRNRLTREGESIPLCQYPIDIEKETSPSSADDVTGSDDGGGGADSYLFLVWPVTVVHRIDERSPFWDMSADQVRTASAQRTDPMR